MANIFLLYRMYDDIWTLSLYGNRKRKVFDMYTKQEEEEGLACDWDMFGSNKKSYFAA